MRVFILTTLFLALSGCSVSESQNISVPAKFCKSQYSGRQRTVTDVSYVCMAYDSNMNCTVNTPIYSDRVVSEVNYTCEWSEW